jgi:hypothetical protein
MQFPIEAQCYGTSTGPSVQNFTDRGWRPTERGFRLCSSSAWPMTRPEPWDAAAALLAVTRFLMKCLNLTQIRHRRSCLGEPGRTGAAPARWCEASTARASTTKAFLAPAALSIGWCLEEASARTTYRHAVVDADQ